MTEVAPVAVMPRIRSALFEIASAEPERTPRWTFRAVAALFLLLFVWTVFAKVDIVAVAEGRLVPETYVKIVQPSEAGIVRDILVREGDSVHQGQVLVRLDPTESEADSSATLRELAMQQLEVRRIDAELAGRPMSRQASDDPAFVLQAQSQGEAHRQAHLEALAQHRATLERTRRELIAAQATLTKLEQTLPSYERSAKAFQDLASQQLVGRIQADEKQRDAMEKTQELAAQRATVAGLEASVEEASKGIGQLEKAYTSDLYADRLQAVQKSTELQQQVTKAAYRKNNLELRAPQDGIVKELATTTVGAVVQPGTVIASLVPSGELLRAEVAIQNQDIGFVHKGQRVRIKVAAYSFQKYGMVDGTVKTVIADSSAERATGSGAVESASDKVNTSHDSLSYKALVRLDTQSLMVGGNRFPLTAGMQLSAEIIQDRRTVLEYLLSPVQRIASEAGRER